ncbi:MAG TPA: sigma factor-like helix-turn-helix DNA-binding protein, partial [Ktedonobacteraceae bacterium]|nr:sigma factor-like helix-turn-helix DNA-binding protein [Ktedonobacteraceae bacterium]
LPTKQRVVVILHYYNGMTLPEMSHTLHTSENTLKKRIQSALINLRRVMYAAEAEEHLLNNPVRQKMTTSVA